MLKDFSRTRSTVFAEKNQDDGWKKDYSFGVAMDSRAEQKQFLEMDLISKLWSVTWLVTAQEIVKCGEAFTDGEHTKDSFIKKQSC